MASAANFNSHIELRRLACDWDGYGVINGHNVYAYQSAMNGWRLLPTDFDSAFTASGYPPNKVILTGWNPPPDTNVTALLNKPAFQRAFWRGVRDAVNGPLLGSSYNPRLDAYYQVLTNNGAVPRAPDTLFPIVTSLVTVVGTNSVTTDFTNYWTSRTWLDSRRTNALLELAGVAAPFSITNNNGANVTTTASSVALGGKAPGEIAYIRISGRATNELVTWGTVTNWSYILPLASGANAITNLGLDRLSNPVATNSITITKSP